MGTPQPYRNNPFGVIKILIQLRTLNLVETNILDAFPHPPLKQIKTLLFPFGLEKKITFSLGLVFKELISGVPG